MAKRMFEKGFGYKSVARTLGLSFNTVRDWNREFKRGTFHARPNLNQYRYGPEIKQIVCDLRDEGLNWRQIEARTGVIPATCRNWVAKRDIATTEPTSSNE